MMGETFTFHTSCAILIVVLTEDSHLLGCYVISLVK